MPLEFGNDFQAVLSRVDYRGSRLRITLTGCGTDLRELVLDGKSVAEIPATLSGEHEVNIRLAAIGTQTDQAPSARRQPPGRAP